MVQVIGQPAKMLKNQSDKLSQCQKKIRLSFFKLENRQKIEIRYIQESKLRRLDRPGLVNRI